MRYDKFSSRSCRQNNQPTECNKRDYYSEAYEEYSVLELEPVYIGKMTPKH